MGGLGWKGFIAVKSNFKPILISLGLTTLILVIIEVLSSTILPFLGLLEFRIPINVLLVLYVGFKFNITYVPIIIFFIQYCYSFFTVEGWEAGTIAGIIIHIIISYFKDVIYLTSAGAIVMFVQLFQLIWFIIISSLFYMKTASLTFVIEKIWRFLPESIVISLLAPVFFMLLDVIWQVGKEDILGE